MRRAAKYSLFALSSLAALIVIALLYLQFADLDGWIEDVERKISESSGYEVVIDGSFDLDIGRETAASLSAISISSPVAVTDQPFVSVANFDIAVDTWSLVKGPIRIVSIDVSDADIELRIDANGEDNWKPPAAEAQSSAGGEAPLLELIKLEDIRLSYNDHSVQGPAVSHRGTLHFAELGVTGDKVHLTGSRVALDHGSIELKGHVEFAESDKPTVVATLSSPSLEIINTAPEDGIADAESEPADNAEAKRFFSVEPLEQSWLAALNLDLGIEVQQLTAGAETVSGLNATVLIDNGALHITPLAFTKGDGGFSADLSLIPGDDAYSLSLSIKAQQLQLDAIASEHQEPHTVPPLDLSIEFSGRGQTMHDIAASSSGSLSGRHHAGLVDMQNSGFLFSDFLSSVFRTINPLAESEPFAELECSIIEITIEDGVATIVDLAAQLDRLMVVGDGKIDLGTEELDITVRTKTREGLGLSLGGVVNSLVAVGGTISEPSLTIDPAGSVTTAGAAVATGGISVLAKSLWDRLSAEADICAAPTETAQDTSD
jgi:uncharacterized protein involved in outer membrane biogenesis